MVETQRQPPPLHSLAPDGQPFSAVGRMHYGPAREFGWRMNVHGMAQAARLRRHNNSVASNDAYTLSIRLRLDDTWRFGTRQGVDAFWQCLARLLSNPSPPQSADRVSSRTRARRGGGNASSVSRAQPYVVPGDELGPHRSSELPYVAMNACGGSGLSVTGNVRKPPGSMRP